MADDPTPPPVPAEPYPGATEVRKLALNTFWPMVQDRADELGLESTADGIDSRLLVAINRGLYAAGAAIWAAGRTAAAAEIRQKINDWRPGPNTSLVALDVLSLAARIAEGKTDDRS